MQKVEHLELKNLSGTGGIGKGSKRRRGEVRTLFDAGYDSLDWGNDKETVSNGGSTSADPR